MPELDDDKTDKLFQVGAGRHDFEYSPAAWEQMEGLLDADDAARRRRFWLFGAGLLLALLLAAVVGHRTVTADTGMPASTIASTAATDDVIPADNADDSRALETTVNPSDEGKASPATALAAELSPATDGTSKKIGNAYVADDLTTDDSSVSTPLVNTIIAPETMATEPSPAGPAAQETTAPLIGKAIDLLPGSGITRIEAPAAVLPVVTPVLEETFSPAAIPAGAFRPGFAATLSAGLVSGTTQVGEFGPRDSRFGAKLDYRFSNKFSLGIGGYYSNVCYNIEGTEYKADNASFSILPKEVESDCDVFEAPLSLTYHPRGSDRSGFYFGGGLTSYFLLTERFTFKYEQPVGPDAPRSWREDNANQHLFGMGQFNLGYQRKAGQGSAFQVETFVQLPLTDIGHGNVSLMTVGASVNYTIDFRRKRK